MNWKPSFRLSIAARVSLFTLAIFLLSLWGLSWFASRLLQNDMERLLGEQQFAATSSLALSFNGRLADRVHALELIAGEIDGWNLMANPAVLQARLEQRPLLQVFFNSGVFITGSDGTAIANVPLSVGRIGTNYMDRDSVSTALKQGKTTIGRPVIGKKLGAPLFTIAAPIHNAQGQVTGTLVGVTDLGKSNFFDEVIHSPLGKTGGYLLLAPQHGIFVTATDKSRIMQPLPAAGLNLMHDKYMQGYEGYGVATNSRGVEELSAAKRIPVAGWLLVTAVPTEEAFDPIYDLQRRMLWATAILTLLAAGLTRWMLRRQLMPLLTTVSALSALEKADQPMQPLPITGQDEVGALIGGFNRLLEVLAAREQTLKESEQRFRLFMEHIPGAAFIKNEDGTTIYANSYMRDVIGVRDWIGKSTRDLFPPSLAEKMIADDHRAIAAGHALTVEEIPTADGRLSHYETHKFSIPRAGQPPFLGGIALDISEREQVQAALRDSEERRHAEVTASLEAHRQARLAALNLLDDAITARNEAQVMAATLDKQIDELRRWQQVTLGREDRILSMKKEVNELLAAQGQSPRYPSALDEGAEK